MAQIGLNITISGLSGKLIIRWLRASSPLAEVGRNDNPSLLTFPYDDVYVIPDLAPVVYKVQLWRSDDGIALDQLIKEWSIDASKQTRNTITEYQYLVGRGWTNVTQSTGDEVWADPDPGDIVLVDERIDGFTKEQIMVNQRGYGTLLDEEYDLHLGGGIELLENKEFDENVAWFIIVANSEIIDIPNDASGGEMFLDVEVIAADRDVFVDSTDNLYKKLCVIEGDGPTVQLTFPNMTLIPDSTHLLINTQKGNHNYTILQFNPGDTVNFFNQQKNIIYLAKGEQIWLYFKDGICRIISYTGNFIRRGSVFPDYDATRDVDSGAVIYSDESTGVLNKSDYPGLYEFVNQLTGDAVCPLGSSVGQWEYFNAGIYPNKRKFGIDTGAETFRVPHLSLMIAKLTSTPGVYEAAQVGEISQNIVFKQGKSDDNESGVSGFYLRTSDATGGTNYGTMNVPFLFNNGLENKIKSFAQKPYIYL